MFNAKVYKNEFYLKNKDKYSKSAKDRYIQNREKILARRRELMKNETPEKRRERLEFHRKYNRTHAVLQKERMQTNLYKFKQYEFAADRRGYVFSLAFDEFVSIFHGYCAYCGMSDSRGIDRVDNSIGYTKENSVSCCEMCNKMKWRFPKDQFLSHAIQIANFNFNNKLPIK
jgi:hypothetical protein